MSAAAETKLKPGADFDELFFGQAGHTDGVVNGDENGVSGKMTESENGGGPTRRRKDGTDDASCRERVEEIDLLVNNGVSHDVAMYAMDTVELDA